MNHNLQPIPFVDATQTVPISLKDSQLIRDSLKKQVYFAAIDRMIKDERLSLNILEIEYNGKVTISYYLDELIPVDDEILEALSGMVKETPEIPVDE